ncbi:hypothetical protein LM500008_40108 [Listeria monocytogenes]|nr:hypothetical protein LM500008_40108 [Listeria monocytogenes]
MTRFLYELCLYTHPEDTKLDIHTPPINFLFLHSEFHSSGTLARISPSRSSNSEILYINDFDLY